MKTRRRRIEKLKKQEFDALSIKFIKYYIEDIVTLVEELSRIAEMLRELLKEGEKERIEDHEKGMK